MTPKTIVLDFGSAELRQNIKQEESPIICGKHYLGESQNLKLDILIKAACRIILENLPTILENIGYGTFRQKYAIQILKFVISAQGA